MRAALVKIIRGDVENVIVADPQRDYPPKGYALIFLDENSPVSAGYQWDESEQFVPPKVFAAVTKDVVTEVVAARYFDPAPVIEKADKTIEVPADQPVKVGDAVDADGNVSVSVAAEPAPAEAEPIV